MNDDEERVSQLERRVDFLESKIERVFRLALPGYLSSFNEKYRRAPMWVHCGIAILPIIAVVIGATWGYWWPFVWVVVTKASVEIGNLSMKPMIRASRDRNDDDPHT